LEVPSVWTALIDPAQSLAMNIERSFKKAKENDAKIQGTSSRLQELEKEFQDLSLIPPQDWYREQKEKKDRRRELSVKGPKLEIKARRLDLTDEVHAYFGRSGADNLKLLRRARAWDYWVHLKDEPGSHGIVFRPKNKEIDVAQWRVVGAKLVEFSLGEKAKSRKGDRFEMLICEVRHVKPIKGDRLGRVNYQNEKVLGFSF
jgi:predicted ribosome quality control (RQC) complex YloA/Tae2 family protein